MWADIRAFKFLVRGGEDTNGYVRLLASKNAVICQPLKSLDIIDSKASSLASIAGIIFASNVFLLERYSTSGGLPYGMTVACLLALAAAISFSGSCLWIMSPVSRRFAELARESEAEKQEALMVAWLTDVYCSRAWRYRLAFIFTTAALAFTVGGLAAHLFTR